MFLDQWARNQRRRDPTITTRPYKFHKNEIISEVNETDAEEINKLISIMKNKVIKKNKKMDDILKIMRITRAYRRDWILKSSPSFTEIIQIYPNF
jgi:hypothetical protein